MLGGKMFVCLVFLETAGRSSQDKRYLNTSRPCVPVLHLRLSSPPFLR